MFRQFCDPVVQNRVAAREFGIETPGEGPESPPCARTAGFLPPAASKRSPRVDLACESTWVRLDQCFDLASA